MDRGHRTQDTRSDLFPDATDKLHETMDKVHDACDRYWTRWYRR